jgi:hypothetical protein
MCGPTCRGSTTTKSCRCATESSPSEVILGCPVPSVAWPSRLGPGCISVQARLPVAVKRCKAVVIGPADLGPLCARSHRRTDVTRPMYSSKGCSMRVVRSNNRGANRYQSRLPTTRPPDRGPLDAHGGSTRTAASMALRLRVSMTRVKLDRQIAAGRSCEPPAALELRVRQLTSPRVQQRTAKNLRGVVEYVDRIGYRRDFSAVVINRAAVRAGREGILGLAERLERTAHVNARGMVLARELVTDGATSPLFDRASERSVAQAIWKISDALGPEEHPSRFDAIAG